MNILWIDFEPLFLKKKKSALGFITRVPFFLTILQWLGWLWGIEIASVGIAILDKQSTILVKTSMEKDVMVPVFVSAQMIQSLKLPYLRPPPGCTFSFFFFLPV